MTDSDPHDFEELYRNTPVVPWDTKAPKESVIEWQEAGLIRGDVLDIGCGLGDNAIYLAAQGHQVTGLDVAATALLTAFSDANAEGREWPRPQVSEATLRSTLGDAGWDIVTLETRTATVEDEDAVFWYLIAERGSVR